MPTASAIRYTMRETPQPMTNWETAEKPIQYQLPVSFLIVPRAVMQGVYS